MTNNVNCWERLASGKYVDINNLTTDDLTIGDVDTSLNHTTRFNGHFKNVEPLTVAQHSYLCYILARHFEPINFKLHLACLTHDFAESIIGDISVPVKYAMGRGYDDFAMPIERLFEQKFFGGVITEELHKLVKYYDLMSLDIERRVLWSDQTGADKWPDIQYKMSLIEKRGWFKVVQGLRYVDLVSMWEHVYNSVYK